MCQSPSSMILLLIASLLCQILGNPIVGGKFIEIQKYPWLASIQKNGQHKCGGSIISEDVILTASHCVKDSVDSYRVRVGSSRSDSGGTWHKVVAKKQHEKYSRNYTTSLNDIALIKVSPPFEFGTGVTKVQLAGEEHELVPGTVVSVAGWGSASHRGPAIDQLRSADLRVVDSRDCAKAYGDKTGTTISSNSQICAAQNGSDACDRDSGGPLVYQFVQVGIVSSGKGCANLNYPGVYTNVARHIQWIYTNYQLLKSSEYPEKPDSFYPTTVPTVDETLLWTKHDILF